MEKNINNKLFLDALDLENMGFRRSMVYKLLNNADMPVVQIGKRKFMHKALFLELMENLAKSNGMIEMEDEE